jgi:hypothetical protein
MWQLNDGLERIWYEEIVVPRHVSGFAWEAKERCPDDRVPIDMWILYSPNVSQVAYRYILLIGCFAYFTASVYIKFEILNEGQNSYTLRGADSIFKIQPVC